MTNQWIGLRSPVGRYSVKNINGEDSYRRMHEIFTIERTVVDTLVF
jgi:hypothetical protein